MEVEDPADGEGSDVTGNVGEDGVVGRLAPGVAALAEVSVVQGIVRFPTEFCQGGRELVHEDAVDELPVEQFPDEAGGFVGGNAGDRADGGGAALGGAAGNAVKHGVAPYGREGCGWRGSQRFRRRQSQGA